MLAFCLQDLRFDIRSCEDRMCLSRRSGCSSLCGGYAGLLPPSLGLSVSNTNCFDRRFQGNAGGTSSLCCSLDPRIRRGDTALSCIAAKDSFRLK